MSCHNSIQEQLPTNPTNQAESILPQASTQQKAPAVRAGKVIAVNLCALGLIFCFFMPWLYQTIPSIPYSVPWEFRLVELPSGFYLQKADFDGMWLWLMPILALVTIWCGLAGRSQKIAGQLAGITPFVFLGFGSLNTHGFVISYLTPWAWLALILGIVLIQLVSPFKLAKPARSGLKVR